jgi:transposase
MTLILTPGQRHEAMVFEPLLESGAVKRRGPGRPKRRPHRIMGDKGDSSRRIRGYACQHGMRITIPRQRHEGRTGPLNRTLYRLRHRIERLINRCKPCRRLATRDEKRAANYQAMWLIAATILWLGGISTLQTHPRTLPTVGSRWYPLAVADWSRLWHRGLLACMSS